MEGFSYTYSLQGGLLTSVVMVIKIWIHHTIDRYAAELSHMILGCRHCAKFIHGCGRNGR